MARLTLVKSNTRANTLIPTSGSTSHRASKTEGEAVRRLLEDQGYRLKRMVKSSNQMEFACPFHEGPNHDRKAATNFYVNTTTGLYTCHAASCGERGNLQSLERYFGVEQDSTYAAAFHSREDKLRVYEAALTKDKREPFYRQGLTDATIERFRLGYDADWHHDATGKRGRYVIPYLDMRRPQLFRFYQPGETKFKYTWEDNTEATLFNAQDCVGDKDGMVILCEGEIKAMLATQMGYAAVAVPGASMWKPEWQGKFTHAKQIIICFDNDNPDFHIYDKPEEGRKCQKCAGAGLSECTGHNPGQDAAMNRIESLGWRAKNVLLPLPNRETRKTDINEFFVRDANTADDFAELLTGKKAAPFKVQTLGDIYETPPDEAHFLVEHGILPARGRLLIAGAPKVGKAERMSAPVLTPHGWTTMGKIVPGDEVVGVDGKPVTVLQIHPQGVKPIYRVTMSDGSSAECTLEHLWTIQTHDDRNHMKLDGCPRWRTVTTQQIADILAEGRARHTYIPIVAPVEYAPVGPQPIDAYAFGLLLGDGGFTGKSVTFTKPDVELHEALAKALPDVNLVSHGEGSFYLTTSRGQINPLLSSLQKMGLSGLKSHRKFVPRSYLYGSVEDRLALLQGLLDTDGWVQWNASHKNSSAYFGTSSEQLKHDVVELVESLGGTTRVLSKPQPKYQGGVGRPAWTVRVRLPEQFQPFRLTRKLDEWLSGRPSNDTSPVRRIVSVDYVDHDEAQCITVDSVDGLYVTERFIVTHNSLLVDNLALSLAAGIPFLKQGGFAGFAVDHPTRTLLLDRELSKWSLFKRLETLVESKPGYRAAFENLLIDHDHLIRLDQKGAYEMLYGLVDHNGAEVIILDTAYKFFGGDVESSSSLMKAFEVLDRLIMETGVSVVMTHHRRKNYGGQGNKQQKDVPDPDSVAGSFLWTGWPNATILLNYLNRSVEDPFNALCSFAAFRDAAPPESLALYRDRESIAYTAIKAHTYDDGEGGGSGRAAIQYTKPTTENVSALMLDLAPMTEEDMLHIIAGKFGCSVGTVRPFFLDAISQGNFEKTNGRPPVVRFAYGEKDVETWEKEHGLPDNTIPIDEFIELGS